MPKARVRVGQRFGKLVAVERLEPDRQGNQRWRFRCACGELYDARVANVTYSLRTLEWGSCKACYFRAGGAEALKARLQAPT